MKAALLAALAALSFATPALADEEVTTHGVSIDATTTSKTNFQATTPGPGTTPYTLGVGATYSVQCVGADVYVATVSSSTGAATAANSRYLIDKAIIYIKVTDPRTWIAVKTVSVTATCNIARVFQ